MRDARSAARVCARGHSTASHLVYCSFKSKIEHAASPCSRTTAPEKNQYCRIRWAYNSEDLTRPVNSVCCLFVGWASREHEQCQVVGHSAEELVLQQHNAMHHSSHPLPASCLWDKRQRRTVSILFGFSF